MNIGFYTGYVRLIDNNFYSESSWELKSNTNVQSVGMKFFGSETSLINLGKALISNYGFKVTIFNSYTNTDVAEFDIIIVSRYINFFTYYKATCPVILWLHDKGLVPWIISTSLHDGGKQLLYNVFPKINKIVVLSEFHMNNIQSNLDVPFNKMTIIGHGINTIDTLIPKEKNRLIWASNWDRGLHRAIKVINQINSVNITFDIYGEDNEIKNDEDRKEWADMYNEIKQSQHTINLLPFINNEELLKIWSQYDVWFYPTHIYETFCITALEALSAGCFCLTSRIGALKEVISNRGVFIEEDSNSLDYYSKTSKQLEYYLLNPDSTSKFRQAGIEWAQLQTINQVASQWTTLMKEVLYD